ncbi:MAG TPA: 1-(5-phosphoribosyl)-5-[(5-phosphoribosylamino)methylideneamino]imidazole-4-carboxamide isomerase [Candidatus Omnitrophota bacterium]|nr:1-(5-phosphoribosyl)-5-[(5-phosphoribosylamino)methylideneamino]imidazole-4-carboxamide isomerase [Candidatus Omnitrophota bacterium]
MLIIPAIDLRGGKVVRWITGSPRQEIPYGDDPLAFARQYEKEGALWLHVIDLDGAIAGKLTNLAKILEIRKASRLKIEVGGGIRNLETVDKLIGEGIDRVILGTKAVDSLFLRKALDQYGDKLAVSADALKGTVKIAGWAESSELSLDEFLAELAKTPLKTLICTEISRDGMMKGPDTENLIALCRRTPGIRMILSGGVSSLDDILKLAGISEPNFLGVIVGRALYEKKFSLEEALRIAERSRKCI